MPAVKAKSRNSVISDDVLYGRKRIIDPIDPITIFIGPEHASKAVCKDGNECVVARAFKSVGHLGCLIEATMVGTRITKLIGREFVYRFLTNRKVAQHIPIFDANGAWNLPPGEYKFPPLSPSYRRPPRWRAKRNSGGKQSISDAKRALPSRTTLSVRSLTKKPSCVKKAVPQKKAKK